MIRNYIQVNASVMLRACFWLLISFAPEEMKKRIRLHKNVASLRNCIGSNRLPDEYGGSGGSWTQMATQWVDELRKSRPFLSTLDRMRYDEQRAGA